MSLSQDYPTTRPTLTLDFAKAKRVDPRVTFTRASTATYFDASGTLRSAADNVPRIDFNPSTLLCQGLLIEEARTNLALYSQDFSTGWIVSQSTLAANAGLAPDNTTTAGKLVLNSGSAVATTRAAYQDTSGLTGINTASIFAKAVEFSVLRIGARSAANTTLTGPDFDLSAGTVGALGNATAASITPVGNGWYRCTATFDFLTGVTAARAYFGSAQATGDGTSGIYIWGAQLEAGAFATSYIPTTTTSLTRSADVASVTTLSPWYNQAQGTFSCEFNTAATTSGANLWETQQTSTSAERIEIGVSSAGVFNPRVVSGGAATVSLTVSLYSFGTTGKIAFAIQPTNYAASFNSATPITSSDADAPTTQEILYLGCRNGNAVFLNGYLRRIVYYPRRLSNAELQSITS